MQLLRRIRVLYFGKSILNKPLRIKMCGMTREQDIARAATLGVDAIGLVFYPQSPRYITLAQAGELLKIKPFFVNIVAVLVNPSPQLVAEVLRELPIDYLQFHGDESPEFCKQFNYPYIKALQVHSKAMVEEAALNYLQASALLLDTPNDGLKGGSGMCFDWTLIPEELTKPLILAGGLNAENAKQIRRFHSIAAVDVCTGIELSAGIKDHAKMSQFVEAVWSNDD